MDTDGNGDIALSKLSAATLHNYQLELIQSEIGQIQDIIARIDQVSQQIKNWTILIWTGTLSLIIGNSNTEIRQLIIFAITIPLLFWVIDGHNRRRQRSFIYRYHKISDYVNSDDFRNSFKENVILNFTFLDIRNRYDEVSEEIKFANLKRSMWFKSMRTFYLGLLFVTFILQVILYPSKPNYGLKESVNTTKKSEDSLNSENIMEIKLGIKKLIEKVDSLENIK